MNSTTTDFNEWLDSLGFDDSSPENNTQTEQSNIANEDSSPELPVNEIIHHMPRSIDVYNIQEESSLSDVQSVSFSEEDVDSLLADNGFTEFQIENAPFEEDESNDESAEEEEDNDEGRELDTVEEIDRSETIVSGNTLPIIEDNIQRMISVAPVTPEEAMSYPQREPLIPENSPTISMDDSTSRFSGTEWYAEVLNKTIMIAGCGGIGRMKNFL